MLSTRAWRVNCRIHGSMDQLSRLISTPHLWRQGPSLKQATSPNVQNILEDFLEKNHCSNGFKVKLLLHKGGLKCRNQETGGFLGVTSRFVPSSKSKNLPNILYKQNMNMFWRCLSWIGLRGYSFNCQFLSAHGTFSWTQIPVLDALSMSKCCF